MNVNDPSPPIVRERADGVDVITINRPDAMNSLSPDATDALIDALGAATDRACRAVVLTGAGPKAFCAGIDVKSVEARDRATPSADVDPIEAQFDNLHRELGAIIRSIHELPVPVVCAVNGYAIGAGFAIAAASDIRIASPNATFADGFINRGISGCELGLSYFLPRLVGAATAFEWMLTGRRIGADEARAAGFVRAVHDGDRLVQGATDIAAQIAALAPMAVTMTKEVMWANLHAGSLNQALALESRTQVMTRNTANAAEARQAFLDKREPRFR